MDFAEVFSVSGLFTLLMLILLQAVLGFDNLLYISIESKRVEESQQAKVRRLGIGLAIALRIVLLFCVTSMISAVEGTFFQYGMEEVEPAAQVEGDVAHADDDHKHESHPTLKAVEGSWFAFAFNFESVVVLFGGGFILYTAIKEIFHMISLHDGEHGKENPTRSFNSALFWIVLMNLVFSFDSILSAMALTENLIIMSLAIVISGIMMIVLADNVSEFLKKNRMYEVLGLFILFIVGVMLISEGGHKAHLVLFGHPVEAMEKSTFYFVIAVLVVVDIVQGRYQKKLLAEKDSKASEGAH
ncbi:MAG: tellurium resistance protein TerC [Planctomycetota bacterium]